MGRVVPYEDICRDHFPQFTPKQLARAAVALGMTPAIGGIKESDLNAYLTRRAELAQKYLRPPLKIPSGEVVYFLFSDGLLKIGVSRNLAKRLKAYATHNACEVELLGTVPGDAGLERGLHKRFARHREHGEWFFFHDDIRDFLKGYGIERKPQREIVL